MSRSPRRVFATPVVITLAAAGCYVETQPTQPAPPPVVGSEQPAPPRPVPETEQPAPVDPPVVTTTNPPPPTRPPVVTTNPPPPRPIPTTEPAKFEQRWRVTRSGTECLAAPSASCPTPKQGQPMPTCNPPPPFKITCPDPMTEPMLMVILRAGATGCIAEPPPPKCPPNARCAAPKTRPVDCPTRAPATR
ncbi:MAG: hypothetical protein WKG01_13490 [Kofleriaceae bacterium]